MSHPDYRPDVDGLRAIAVLAVILFHAGVPFFGGGYVGVDVFFVISGYLITGILLRSLQTGRYSIGDFYERRIRRIFPALFVVVAVSSVAAILLLFPPELSNYGHSLAATSLFFANYHFMADTGYFAAPAASKPLLHMWSLAVEEQFYVVFPLLMAVAWRWLRQHILALVVGLALLSFAYAVWLMSRSPDQAFYSAPARAWELLVGGGLAVATQRGLRPASPLIATPLAAVALAAVLASIAMYSEATPFPGLSALVPVLGSACLLYAMSTAGNPVARILGSAPLRFVGLISYSLYLWHWPIFMFYKVWRVQPVSAWESFLLVLATFAAATLSWRYVEQPARAAAPGFTRKRALVGGAAAMLVSASVGLALVSRDGWPERFEPHALAVLATADDAPDHAPCPGIAEPAASSWLRGCRLGKAVGAPTFAIWGDSHAEALLPALEAAADTAGVAGVYSVRGGCPPLLGVRQTREGFRDCWKSAEAFLAELEGMPEVRTVFIAARWALYVEGTRFRGEAGHSVFIVDDKSGEASKETNAAVFERGLIGSIERLRRMGREVVFVGQVPETEFHVPRAVVRLNHLGRTSSDADIAPSRAEYESRQSQVEGVLRSVAPELKVLRPELALCASGRCMVTNNGLPIYRDSNHLTATFARTLAPLFAAQLRPNP